MGNSLSSISALLLIGIGFLISCTMPEKVPQLELDITKEVVNDSVHVHIYNPSHTPIRLMVYDKTNAENRTNEFTLNPFSKISCALKGTQAENFVIWSNLGDPTIPIQEQIFELPFPKGKSYKILQGFNGRYSHGSSDYSRYAIDFAMPIGDTICAAADGYVVGVVNPYTIGRKNKKRQPYANFITLYHPTPNLYTQYVHLAHLGNLVEVGDTIQVGQPIALSGNTGYTDSPHLHFNVLKPVASDAYTISTSYDFRNYQGAELKKGTLANH